MRKIKSASAASSPKIPSADRSSNTTPMSKHSRSASTPGQLGRQVGHAVQHSEMQGNECRSQQHQPYLLHDGTVLNKTVAERDIGVKVDNGLKPTQQSKQAANRANHILYQLTKAIAGTVVLLWSCTKSVRPHLKFAVPAWSPWTASDYNGRLRTWSPSKKGWRI